MTNITALQTVEQAEQKYYQAANKATTQWNAELKASIVDGEVDRGSITPMGKFSVTLRDLSADDVAGLVEYFKKTTADRF